MQAFVVERYLAAGSAGDLDAVAAEARAAAGSARFVSATFLPAEEILFCVFEAPSLETVRHALDCAGFAYDRIAEAVHAASEEPS